MTSDHYVGARSELLLRFLFETIHFDLRACFGTGRSLGFLCGLGQVEESENSVSGCNTAITSTVPYVQMKSNTVKEEKELKVSVG